MWAWFVSTTIGRWIVGIGAVILAALGFGAFAFVKGKERASEADKAKDAETIAEAAQATVNAAVVRQEVANESAKLPEAPAQRVLDADRATAAGHLRDNGWMRGPSTSAANPGRADPAD